MCESAFHLNILRTIFSLFYLLGNGTLEWDEFLIILLRLNQYIDATQLKRRAFDHFDQDKDGKISAAEFRATMIGTHPFWTIAVGTVDDFFKHLNKDE